ncbi:hypothetical protein AVEN_35295-1 [Araneus ventricosus]|uniref:Uncharacterized protein n=1 Tax=Araneus ventricosus TaxID=182803 RepID=A0A4Y2Q4U0_ARAVE|nr:hypothetical protein AVEN_35295-1 [Araneus ventricosus]
MISCCGREKRDLTVVEKSFQSHHSTTPESFQVRTTSASRNYEWSSHRHRCRRSEFFKDKCKCFTWRGQTDTGRTEVELYCQQEWVPRHDGEDHTRPDFSLVHLAGLRP